MLVSYLRKITDNVKHRLYALSGNECALCEKKIFDNSCNTGEICHIEAISKNGPRYNPNLTNEIVNSYENLILLCPSCHKRIDDKSNLNKFTVDFLKKLKKEHENRVFQKSHLESIANCDFLFSYIIISDQLKKALIDYSEEEIQFSLKTILQGNNDEKRIMWTIVCSCCQKGDNEQINLIYLHNIFDHDFDLFVYEMDKLKQLGYIRETKYSNDLDGDIDYISGDFLPNCWNYRKQATQGEWYLDRLGHILLIVRRYLNSDSSFCQLIFNKDINVLKHFYGNQIETINFT